SASEVPAARKYPWKFSSPESSVPHGVSPPAQLPRVPSTVVPEGSSTVLSRSPPAAGPVSANSSRSRMRRLSAASLPFEQGEVLVRVLVVHEHHGALAVAARDLLDLGVVVVVAELPLLGLGALRVPVELGGVGEQRIAPTDDRRPGEALGHGELVDRVLDRSDRLEAQLGAVRGERPRLPAIAAVAVALAVALAGTGERPLGAAERDRQRRRGAAEDGAARQRGGG